MNIQNFPQNNIKKFDNKDNMKKKITRLTKEQINQILTLHKNGVSLNKTSSKLKIPKTTLYYHVRKHFGKKIKDVELNLTLAEELGEFIGAFAGDGGFYFRKNTYIYNTTFFIGYYEREYAKRLFKLIYLLFNIKPYLHKLRNQNVVIVRVYRKKIYETIRNFLIWEKDKTYTVRLKDEIFKRNDLNFLKGFLRGLVNTDGAVDISRNRIMFASISKQLRYQASNILDRFYIKHCNYIIKGKGNRRDLYCFEIGAKSEVNKFDKIISLTNPYKEAQLQQIIQKTRR